MLASFLQRILTSSDATFPAPVASGAPFPLPDASSAPVPAPVVPFDTRTIEESAPPETVASKANAPLGQGSASASHAQRAGAAASEITAQPAISTEVDAAPAARPESGDSVARAERAERILEQVRLRIRPELSEALVELRPRELGRIAIHLSVRDGRVRASVRAERAEALAVLEAHVPELRAMFEAAGLEPRTIDLGMGLAHGGSQHSDHARGDGDGRGAGSTTSGDERVPVAPAYEPLALALADRMGIDTYA